MKHIKKILFAAGFALAIGGCAFGISSTLVSANAKVASTDSISTEHALNVANGEYVVIGNKDGTKFVTGCGNNWLNLGTTKTDYVKYAVEDATGGFYLKDVDTNNYIYSSAAKKVEMSSTNKSVLTLTSQGELKTGSNYFSVNTNIRPYTSLQSGGAVYLYKISSATITGISVKTQPNKTSYKEGEKFDPTGLVLTASYSDGTENDITSGYSYSPEEGLLSTDTSVVISYLGKETSVSITVSTLSGLYYTGSLTKTEYFAGEQFDPTGITVNAVYSNGDEVDVTSSVVWSSLAKGNTSVTGTYGGRTISIDGLTVTAAAAFIEVTDSSQIHDGSKIVITTSDSSQIAGEFSASSEIKGKFLSESIEEVEGMITPTLTSTVFTVQGTTDSWALKTEEGYVKFTGTGNQNIAVEQIEYAELTSDYLYKISPNGIESVGKSGRGIRFNNDISGFTNYSLSIGKGIKLYCQGGTVEDAITGISLSPATDQIINLGSSLSVTPTVTGGNEADMTVQWSLSQSGIVTLSNDTTESGSALIITPTAIGEVTLTGTCVGDTSFNSSIKITVVDPNTVSSVSIQNGVSAYGICHINNTTTLTASVKPDSAVNKNVTWTSNDTSVATINATSGVVTSVKPGVTKITATSVLTSSVSDTIDFIVFSQKGTKTTCPLAPIDINNSLTYNTWTYNVDSEADSEFTGSYFIKGIVAETPEVKNGKYSFKMVDEWGGEIYISKLTSSSTISMSDEVMVFADQLNISAINEIHTVANGSIEGTPSPASVSITGLNISGPTSVKVGKTITLNPTLTPAYTTQRNVNWTSSNTSVATVVNGVVTGVAEGTATIKATSASNSAICDEVTVTVNSATAIAGKYTFVSNTTTYVQPQASQVTTYLEGFDSSVFQSDIYSNSDVRFGCASNPTDIFIGYNGAFSFGLSWDTVMDYTIAKVTFKGVKSDGAGTYITSKYQGYDASYAFPISSEGGDFSFYPFSYMITSYGASMNNIYCEAIEVEVVENTNTSALEAYFNQSILDLTAKDCADLNVRTSTWDYMKSSYDNLVYINEDAVLGVKNATASQSGNAAEQAAARYDYILGIYGTVSYVNFLGRTITPIGRRFVSQTNNIYYIAALIVGTSIILIAGVALIFIKKKKHSK